MKTANRAVRLTALGLIILSVLLSAVSCFSADAPDAGLGTGDNQSDVQDNANVGSSTVVPDSSTDNVDGSDEKVGEPDFITNGSEDENPSDLPAVTRGLLSGVRIVSKFERYIGYGQSNVSEYKKEGSGVIYRLDRAQGNAYVITNFHVVYHPDSITPSKISNKIEMYLYGQEDAKYKIDASFVGGSLTHDIAVLKIENNDVIKNSHAIAPAIADSEKIRVFDDVFAVGNPEGFGISVTEGKINVDLETLSLLGPDSKTTLKLRVMRISAAINEGNSGGGLFTSEGELCGIICAKRTGDDVDNIAYAIPINLAKSIADILISPNIETKLNETGFYKYQLGITMSSAAMGVIIDEDGNLVRVERVELTEILESSPLYGKLAVGDILTSITVGEVTIPVTRVHHIIDAMLLAKDGNSVSVTVEREGVSITETVTINAEMLVKVN